MFRQQPNVDVLIIHSSFQEIQKNIYEKFHCMKSVRIPSFSDPYFPAFGLNTQTLSLCIQSEYRK